MTVKNMTIHPENSMSDKELSNYIRAFLKTMRLKEGLNQTDISKVVGKTRSSITAWERTDPDSGPIFNPGLRDIRILCTMYGISSDKILDITALPDFSIGIAITKKDFFFYDNKPIICHKDNQDVWALINTKGSYISFNDGSRISFEDIDDDEKFQLIPNNVYRREAMYPDPLDVEDIKEHISTTDEPLSVWVLVNLNGQIGGSPLDGSYKITSEGVERAGVTLDYDSYGSTWIAFPEKPEVIYDDSQKKEKIVEEEI